MDRPEMTDEERESLMGAIEEARSQPDNVNFWTARVSAFVIAERAFAAAGVRPDLDIAQMFDWRPWVYWRGIEPGIHLCDAERAAEIAMGFAIDLGMEQVRRERAEAERDAVVELLAEVERYLVAGASYRQGGSAAAVVDKIRAARRENRIP